MAELSIDFGWQRDAKGYRLVEAEPAREGEPWIHPQHPEWGPQPPPMAMYTPERPQRVIGISGELEAIRPLERQKGKNLFVTFANIAPSGGGVCEFVARHGPLTKVGFAESGQSVPEAIERSQAMKSFIIAANGTGDMASLVGPEGIQLSGIDAAIVWDKRAKTPRLQYSPRNLLDALWMQLAYGLSSGLYARKCPQCGNIFTTGPGSFPPRRGDAEFCSHEHQILFNSRKRSKGRPDDA
jgi:hypothetical protein